MKQDASCSFCGNSYLDVGMLVEGPAKVYICSACCDKVSGKLADKGKCSFCRKSSLDVGLLFNSASGVAICGDCIALSQRIY